jgi:alanine racemase
LKERYGSDGFVVWSGRRSGERFLAGFRDVASELAIAIVDGDDEPEFEVRLNQILGGHPELRCAVSLETHLFSVRRVPAGDGVSYGATFVAPENMRVGLAPVGFADGIDRALSGSFRVHVGGVDAPVIGRIAMDSISIDLRRVPDAELGSVVTVYGDVPGSGWTIRDAADFLGVLPVELITRLSERAEVVWR